jgi:hypothetical protein
MWPQQWPCFRYVEIPSTDERKSPVVSFEEFDAAVSKNQLPPANNPGRAEVMNERLSGAVHLYGNRAVGAGWIVGYRAADGSAAMLGDGEPKEGRTFNDALREACDALVDVGVQGRIAVHMDLPSGPRRAVVDVRHPPYFGQLEWGPGVVLTISAEEVEAAAE